MKSFCKKVICWVLGLAAVVACQTRPSDPGYIVQVSLGGWNSPDYTADEIIARLIPPLPAPASA